MMKMFEVMDNKDQKVYLLNEMADMYDDEESEDYDFISRRLVCPSCKVKISDIIIDEESEIIRLKKKDHLFGCDYYGFKINQVKLKKDLAARVNLLELAKNEGKNTKKFFPKKCIERKISLDDIDMIKYFYGTVTLREAHSKDGSRYVNFSMKAPKGDIITISFQGAAIKAMQKDLELFNNNLGLEIEVKLIAKMVEVSDYFNVIIKNAQDFEYKVIDLKPKAKK